MDLQALMQRHADEQEAISLEFERALQRCLDLSTQAVIKELNAKLGYQNGVVQATVSNQKILSSIDDAIAKSLSSNGYDAALRAYTDSFNGQFVAFNEVLSLINSELEWPLSAPVFKGVTLSELEALKNTQRTLVEDAVATAAGNAKRSALVSIGAVTQPQLTELIAEQLGKSLSQAQSLAHTGITTFYRAIADKGYRMIEADLPGFKVRYTYDGPLDTLNRPFCEKLQRQARKGKSWTLEEINNMSNGQLPNVRLTGGGYRCRHQWIIDTKDLRQQQRQKGRPPRMAAPPSRVAAQRLQARERIRRAMPRAVDRQPFRERINQRRGK